MMLAIEPPPPLIHVEVDNHLLRQTEDHIVHFYIAL